jgi:hypothetical protein
VKKFLDDPQHASLARMAPAQQELARLQGKGSN